MEKIKILIADDEKLIVDGLRLILESYEDIQVVGGAANGREAFEKCKKYKPDVVLMDIRMSEYDGVLGTKLIKESFNEVKILILTTFNDFEYITEALKSGASGYLLKDSEYDTIYEAIKASIKGGVVITPEVAEKMLCEEQTLKADIDKIMQSYNINEKELLIIQEVAKGLTNKEIAEKLFLSEGTIKNNITNILSKLSLRDRTQLTIFAFKNGLAD
ncbi:response regulator transcription factor [Clostridium oryzae]|uniref:Stage 0 sporulation protein A homolog n=1 Tax=Clostridium oryzae TaxID=1450648 RepID=A0A1V4I6Z4_9CLOT|nr:response regulator transcription factor [Clostridium oryzae]OPJ55723.1 transcriptional regulatory protein DegU [Clostridium oryzae]